MMRTLLLGANLGIPLAWVTGGFEPSVFVAMFATHMLTLYATLMPRCRWWGPVQTTHEGDGVWLTIDDGPDGEHTRTAMDLLESKDARATFFLIADKANADPDLIEEIIERGHGIGNHTLTHPATTFWRLGPGRLKKEIQNGLPSPLFRAPAGMRNMFVHPILNKLGLRLVAWSARGYDGRDNDADQVVAKIAKKLQPGSIVLLHEGRRAPEGGSLLLETLPKVLEQMSTCGLSAESPRERAADKSRRFR